MSARADGSIRMAPVAVVRASDGSIGRRALWPSTHFQGRLVRVVGVMAVTLRVALVAPVSRLWAPCSHRLTWI